MPMKEEYNSATEIQFYDDNDVGSISFNETNQEIFFLQGLNYAPNYIVQNAEVDEVNPEKREPIRTSEMNENIETNFLNKRATDTERIVSSVQPDDSTLTESQLLEAKTCKICNDNEVKVVYLPCCHLVTCLQCSVIEVNCLFCERKIDSRLEMRL